MLFRILFRQIEKRLQEIAGAMETTGGTYRNELRYCWKFLHSDCPKYLSFVHNTNSENVPMELIHPLEDLVNATGTGTIVLFMPSEEHNYTFVDVLYLIHEGTEKFLTSSDLRAELKAEMSKTDEWKEREVSTLGLISFPSMERRSFLQAPLIGHEIGHSFAIDRLKRMGFIDEAVTAIRKEIAEIVAIDSPEYELQIDVALDHFPDYLTEIYCDLVEVHFFGISALFSDYNFYLGTLNPDNEGAAHPPERYRVKHMLSHAKLDQLLPSLGKSFRPDVAEQLDKTLLNLKKYSEDTVLLESRKNARPWLKVLLQVIDRYVDRLDDDVKDALRSLEVHGTDLDLTNIQRLYERLEAGITPNLVTELFEGSPKECRAVEFRHIVLAAWVYRICEREKITDLSTFVSNCAEIDRLCLRGTEVNYIYHVSLEHRCKKHEDDHVALVTLGLKNPDEEGLPAGPVLNKGEILRRLRLRGQERLHITPVFNVNQITNGAVDVRLGNEFIVIRRTEFSALDVAQSELIGKQVGQYQHKYKIDFGDSFVLHPKELVLGSTLEFVSIPDDIFAWVISRSSWGRLGLMIATATAVNPGYKGCLTLELINLGEVPLTLYAGLPVAQLVLQQAGKGIYAGSYQSPTGPEFSNVHEKRLDNEFWTDPFRIRKR
jgi:dCTP deaminase